MKRELHDPFHFHALAWLREKMGVNTRSIVPEQHTASARLSGYVMPADYHSVLGFLAVMLMICAATVAIASARAGLGPSLAYTLQVAAIGTTALAVVLFVIDNWREHRLARNVEVVMQASADAEVDATRLARWHADAREQLWVVSERGFTPDALALARAHAVRCFTVRKHWIEEVLG
jgi:hypothetical protein